MNYDSLNTAFSLKINDVIYTGKVKSTTDNSLSVLFDSPDEVKGIVLSIDENSMESSYNEIKISAEPEKPGVFRCFYKAVSVLRTGVILRPSDDGYEYTNEEFRAIFDSAGDIKWLKLPEGEFYFNN